tara:strand:- start:911 stop:1108 length:198 start_codon:yes stop_codon:yes gene_type:complete
MKPSEVLKQLNALREEYRRQSLSFTSEQKAEYDRLLKLRRERVKSFFADDKVSKGGTSKQNVDVT